MQPDDHVRMLASRLAAGDLFAGAALADALEDAGDARAEAARGHAVAIVTSRSFFEVLSARTALLALVVNGGKLMATTFTVGYTPPGATRAVYLGPKRVANLLAWGSGLPLPHTRAEVRDEMARGLVARLGREEARRARPLILAHMKDLTALAV